MASVNKPLTAPTPMLGIAGWSGTGKTTLIERLTRHFSERNLRIATIKHTHHRFEIDRNESDTARHRSAGAAETAIVSGHRIAVIEEIDTLGEPSLENVAARLQPADLILVEGFKSAAIPKIEIRRAFMQQERALAPTDPLIFAIAADYPLEDAGRLLLDLNDTTSIATAIEEAVGPFDGVPRRRTYSAAAIS